MEQEPNLIPNPAPVPLQGEGGNPRGVEESPQHREEETQRENLPTFATCTEYSEYVGDLAKRTLETRLEVAAGSPSPHLPTSPSVESVASLFDVVSVAVENAIKGDPVDHVKAILALPPSILYRAMWKWSKLPYVAIREAISRQSAANSSEKDLKDKGSPSAYDIDEWIMRNDSWLCEEKGLSWSEFMVRLSKHADIVFPNSIVTRTKRTIERSPCSGFTVLDQKRATRIQVQPSTECFEETFVEMTGGILAGLNWDNVLVAGGIALGALLCVDARDTVATPKWWENSDIDIFIHGLTQHDAVEKINHIFKVFKSNLPPNTPAFAVRNSRTITFYAKYPIRRLQIILKLYENPSDVFMGFDLDICKVGWDGKEVWLSPVGARAIETGYSIFTMAMARRAHSSANRILKYANKGYGVRFLPSYNDSFAETQSKRVAADAVPTIRQIPPPLSTLEAYITEARGWRGRLLHAHQRRSNMFGHLYHGYMPTNAPAAPTPVIGHYSASLDDLKNLTKGLPSGGKYCLSDFGSFMRHVAIWEAEMAGQLVVQKGPESPYPGETAPQESDKWGAWNEDFTMLGFMDQVDTRNLNEFTRLHNTIRGVRAGTGFGLPYLGEQLSVRSIAYAHSIEDLLSPTEDLQTPLWLPPAFVVLANETVRSALQELGLPVIDMLTVARTRKWPDEQSRSKKDHAFGLQLVYWRVPVDLMWEGIDNRIEEVFAILRIFRGAQRELHSFGNLIDYDSLTRALFERGRRRGGSELEQFYDWVVKPTVHGGVCVFHPISAKAAKGSGYARRLAGM
ncbi:hypothetical protein BOTBODRAFT_146486 [Botryobasidium botryosum FD-172 SS1]|uniref:Uncharacterized protein n=1 Tax=Botryobasidium botryosum (strain FD-172 SS1) TaxID=930990 RepID=A0A067MN23_BOTB1|nr:hypothetical protein BOTBODRAFT_146486 [Botryobasidium botryosum FD-172 SS1]